LEAVKLAEERDIQKNRFHTQKKNREEITKKLLDAQEKMKALLQDIDARKLQKTAMQQEIVKTTISAEIQQMIMNGFQKTERLNQQKCRRTAIEEGLKEDIKNIRNKEREKQELLQRLKEKEAEKAEYLQNAWENQKKKCAKLSAEIEKAQVNQIEIQGKKKRRNSFIWKIWLLFWQLLWKMACPVLYAEVFIMKNHKHSGKKKIFRHCKNKRKPWKKKYKLFMKPLQV
jgi:hypothetical protein